MKLKHLLQSKMLCVNYNIYIAKINVRSSVGLLLDRLNTVQAKDYPGSVFTAMHLAFATLLQRTLLQSKLLGLTSMLVNNTILVSEPWFSLIP